MLCFCIAILSGWRKKKSHANFPTTRYETSQCDLLNRFGFQITSCYMEGDTWYTKFAELSSSYEECRAECVGLFLCTEKRVLRSVQYCAFSCSFVINI